MTDSEPNGRLDAYLERIDLTQTPPPTAAGLATLIAAHRRAIAFENLDIRLGRDIRIDSDSVFDKLVTRRRGGYCFEQNRLLGDMLTRLGFVHRPLLARVRLGLPGDMTPPRTHILLRLSIDGEDWLADAGFGGSGLPPLLCRDGAQATTPDGARHRVRHIGTIGSLDGQWLLERAGPVGATDGRAMPHGDWQPQYSFDLGEVAQDDLEQCNHWTSTRPNTRFTSLHFASIVLPDGFASLTEYRLTQHEGGVTSEHMISNAEDYAATLQSLFKLDFSAAEARALPLFSAQDH